jgi:hypothetical protein
MRKAVFWIREVLGRVLKKITEPASAIMSGYSKVSKVKYISGANIQTAGDISNGMC